LFSKRKYEMLLSWHEEEERGRENKRENQ